MVQTVIITQPDDWHVHFRDLDALEHTVAATAGQFARALVMPNLNPPLTTVADVLAYRKRIANAVPPASMFMPFMTLYLNESVPPEEITIAKKYPEILGAKLYPAGATTHAEQGARSIKALYPLFEAMQAEDLVLQVHGEVTHSDIFDREALFIETYLLPITKQFPKLRIVLEHISTKAAVDFIKASSDYVAATITPHHLLYNRNALLAGGIKPHYYCLPILKRQSDQLAIQEAAVSGHPGFFAGTDSAPHTKKNKESACGCAGIYSAPYAISIYTTVFEKLGKLDKLNDFMSVFGARFYRQAINKKQLELVRIPQTIPDKLPLAEDCVVPIAANEILPWSIKYAPQK